MSDSAGVLDRAGPARCKACGCEIGEEEKEDAGYDRDLEPLCSGCFEDETFWCGACGERDFQDIMHALIVVAEPMEDRSMYPSRDIPRRKVRPGTYLVVDRLYFGTDGLGGGWLYGRALRRIGDVDKDFDFNDYKVYHMCECCQVTFRTRRTRAGAWVAVLNEKNRRYRSRRLAYDAVIREPKLPPAQRRRILP